MHDTNEQSREQESVWWKMLRHFTILMATGWLALPIYVFWLWEWIKKKGEEATRKGAG